ncbi:hypothetical protein RHMOL_Rhmol06G0159500 [Rhododendron molle]|uniref:Uncharacterized protein n=1 Tax=Rhododendron molle TaxID=49168 RepID=A0ACC0NF40_RHOML|nr:hypothetical protein RHMOL_Rhmol06G0159500 [Rhododendron molle]
MIEGDPKGKSKVEVPIEDPKVEILKAKKVHKPLERTVEEAIVEPPRRTLPKKQVPTEKTYKEAVTKMPPKQATVPKKQPLLEKTLKEARIEYLPRQVTLLQKTALEPRKSDSGGKSNLNPQAKEFRLGQGPNMQCNVVVILPADLKAKDNTPAALEGDFVDMGQTTEILNESFSVGLNGPSVIVLKDETEGRNEDRATSVIFAAKSCNEQTYQALVHCWLS